MNNRFVIAALFFLASFSAYAGGGGYSHGPSHGNGSNHGDFTMDEVCVNPYMGHESTKVCHTPAGEYWTKRYRAGKTGLRVDWTIPVQVYNTLGHHQSYGVVYQWRDEVLLHGRRDTETTVNTFDWSCDRGYQWTVETTYGKGKKHGRGHGYAGGGGDRDRDRDRDYGNGKGKIKIVDQVWSQVECDTNPA